MQEGEPKGGSNYLRLGQIAAATINAGVIQGFRTTSDSLAMFTAICRATFWFFATCSLVLFRLPR